MPPELGIIGHHCRKPEWNDGSLTEYFLEYPIEFHRRLRRLFGERLSFVEFGKKTLQSRTCKPLHARAHNSVRHRIEPDPRFANAIGKYRHVMAALFYPKYRGQNYSTTFFRAPSGLTSPVFKVTAEHRSRPHVT